MYLILGITGKVGGAAAQRLLDQKQAVRAMVRDEAKAQAWAAKGVEVVRGEWEDSEALAQALRGVQGVYLMVPPIQSPSPDFREAKAIIASYQQALSKAAPPKIVVLSSMGSEKTSKLGLITSTHLLEEGLQEQTGPVAFIRAGSFYENYLHGLQTAAHGTLPIFYAPTERPVPMVATQDIGAEIARLLTTDWTGKRIIELGSMVSADDLATELGKAVHRDVRAEAIPRTAWATVLEGIGMPKGGTWAFEEMVEGVNSGWIGLGVAGTESVSGTTPASEVFAAAAARSASA